MTVCRSCGEFGRSFASCSRYRPRSGRSVRHAPAPVRLPPGPRLSPLNNGTRPHGRPQSRAVSRVPKSGRAARRLRPVGPERSRPVAATRLRPTRPASRRPPRRPTLRGAIACGVSARFRPRRRPPPRPPRSRPISTVTPSPRRSRLLRLWSRLRPRRAPSAPSRHRRPPISSFLSLVSPVSTPARPSFVSAAPACPRPSYRHALV